MASLSAPFAPQNRYESDATNSFWGKLGGQVGDWIRSRRGPETGISSTLPLGAGGTREQPNAYGPFDSQVRRDTGVTVTGNNSFYYSGGADAQRGNIYPSPQPGAGPINLQSYDFNFPLPKNPAKLDVGNEKLPLSDRYDTLTPEFTQSEIVNGNLPGLQKAPSFNYAPKTSVAIPQDQLDTKDTSPENAKRFFNREVADVTATQDQVVAERAKQPTNVGDLTTSRIAEGFDQAKSDSEQANAYFLTIQEKAANIEREVRAEFNGTGASESQVLAEISQRTKDMEPLYNRAAARAKIAQANLDSRRIDVQEHFGAARADAKEAVDRVTQKLGFQTENINTAYGIMTGMKNYELTVDAQKDKVRDSYRAIVSQGIANPEIFQRMTPQEIANLAQGAQMDPSMLAGIVDKQRNGDFWVNPKEAVDGYGNLPFLWINRATGATELGRIKDFSHIAPKTDEAQIAAQKLISNASVPFQNAVAHASQVLRIGLSQISNQEQRLAMYQEAVAEIGEAAAKPDADGKINPANWQAFTEVSRAFYIATTSGPVEKFTSETQPILNNGVRK